MSNVQLERSDGVAVVTLMNHERRNALDATVVEALSAVLNEIDADETIGAMVLGGGPWFCAGADLGVLGATGADPAEDASFRAIERIYAAFVRVGSMAVPTIAAVRGGAVGAGMNLMLATDLRVVSGSARLISGFARIGVHPGGGHLALLHRTAGREVTAAVGLFGQEIDGARAAATGLAWTAIDDDQVDATAFELAATPARDPALARRVVASFRRETAAGGLPWDVAVEVERSPQMWSFRRR